MWREVWGPPEALCAKGAWGSHPALVPLPPGEADVQIVADLFLRASDLESTVVLTLSRDSDVVLAALTHAVGVGTGVQNAFVGYLQGQHPLSAPVTGRVAHLSPSALEGLDLGSPKALHWWIANGLVGVGESP